MPESHTQASDLDRALGRGLAYPELPDGDGFTLRVMERIVRQLRRRRLILGGCGAVWAAFGLLGAGLLLEPLAALLAGLPITSTMQAALGVTAAIALYGWFMNEDVSLAT